MKTKLSEKSLKCCRKFYDFEIYLNNNFNNISKKINKKIENKNHIQKGI